MLTGGSRFDGVIVRTEEGEEISYKFWLEIKLKVFFVDLLSPIIIIILKLSPILINIYR